MERVGDRQRERGMERDPSVREQSFVGWDTPAGGEDLGSEHVCSSRGRVLSIFISAPSPVLPEISRLYLRCLLPWAVFFGLSILFLTGSLTFSPVSLSDLHLLSVNVQESLAEVGVSGGLLQGQGR